MIDIGYVALDSAQSPALAATKPDSLAKVPEIADQPYGAPKHTWVTKAGTNIDHRLAFPLLSTAASGAKRPPLPERVSLYHHILQENICQNCESESDCG